ncbi:MAG: type IV secretion system DotC family protein [Magnetococcus sp. WYHC-3]
MRTCLHRQRFRIYAATLLLSVFCAPAAQAAEPTTPTITAAPQEPSSGDEAVPTRPISLNELLYIEPENKVLDEGGLPLDIRRDALKEAAISFGARGGLAWRSYDIRQQLDKNARYLDRVYDFRRLLIAAPSGLLIEPPIISENINSMLIETDGQQAAVSDRIYNIINNARIVSTPRSWRNYMERDWGTVEPPPDILRPINQEERKVWIDLVTRGWEEGVRQADEIFQDDLNLLIADFQGMIRYRVLLAQGMVSPPYALQVDRGITGGGNEMRIGDRAVQITGVPELMTGSDQWQPANR